MTPLYLLNRSDPTPKPAAIGAAPAPVEAAPAVTPLLTAVQVAAIVGVSAKRVYELGIPAVRISERSLRWRPDAVSAWITSHEEGR